MKKKFFITIFFLVIILSINMTFANSDIIVILDPGHGASDTGAIYDNLYERDINWKIAKKVKEIFDKTPGITGILSREENTNPSLKERGLLAKNKNADLLVSFHINASAKANSAGGAEVYITGDTNLPRYYQNSKKTAESILSNLRSIGIPSRSYAPILKWSRDGETYDDGFLSDYYGIIRNPMYYRIPGILIEHCYINNTSDRTNFLSSDEKLYKMAEADAKAIIENKELFRQDYVGNINTDLKTMKMTKNSAGKDYIYGEVLIAEWIGNKAFVPNTLPKMTLKSTDGTYSADMYVKHENGLMYYYDRVVSDLDTSKQYYIEVTLTSTKNIGKNKTQKANINTNPQIGTLKNKVMTIQSNNIVFKSNGYVGEVNTDLKTMKLGVNPAKKEYIYGELLIAEWINGKANAPKNLPKMTFKSTDGTYSTGMYVKQVDGLKYYYDRVVADLDMSKQYYIEVELTTPNNISDKKIQKANINTGRTIGTLKGKNMTIQNNNIVFKGNEYNGEINTDLKTMKLGVNPAKKEYIYGELLIAEWVNGNANVPSGLPKMTFKSTDGTYSTGMYVKHLGGLNYYYDRVVSDLDMNKEYYIEVELTNPNNVSSKKKQKANINTGKTIGTLKGNTMTIQNNNIVFKGKDYYGEINTDLKTMKLGKNSEGKEYIYGEILIAEWIGKTANVPNGLPTMTLKSTDGKYSQGINVKHLSGLSYYYDKYITYLDTSKEYYIEVKLTNANNKSTKKTQNANMNVGKIGSFKGANINIKNNKMIFETTKVQTQNNNTTTQTAPKNNTSVNTNNNTQNTKNTNVNSSNTQTNKTNTQNNNTAKNTTNSTTKK